MGLNHTGRVIDTVESETLNLCIRDGYWFNIANTIIIKQADFKLMYDNCINYDYYMHIVVTTSMIVIIYSHA